MEKILKENKFIFVLKGKLLIGRIIVMCSILNMVCVIWYEILVYILLFGKLSWWCLIIIRVVCLVEMVVKG